MPKILYDSLEKDTGKAYLLKFGKAKKEWIPISQIEHEDLTAQVLQVPDWIVKVKGLEEYVMDGKKPTPPTEKAVPDEDIPF